MDTRFVILSKDIPSANMILMDLYKELTGRNFRPIKDDLETFLNLLKYFGVLNQHSINRIIQNGEEFDDDSGEALYDIIGNYSGPRRHQDLAFEDLAQFLGDGNFMAIVDDKGRQIELTVENGEIINKEL